MPRIEPGHTVVIDGLHFSVEQKCSGSGYARRASKARPGTKYCCHNGQWIVIRELKVYNHKAEPSK